MDSVSSARRVGPLRSLLGLLAALFFITGCGGGSGGDSVYDDAGNPIQSGGQVAFASGVNRAPAVNFTVSELIFNQNSNVLPFADAVVTDDQDDFTGGTLSVSQDAALVEDVEDVSLFATSTIDIGQVSGDGTPNLSVALNANATPANVALFLQQLEANSTPGARLGEGDFQVVLDDGQGLQGHQSRSFLVLGEGGLRLTVNPAQPVAGENYQTITAAIARVCDQTGAAGSLITVTAGDYTAEDLIDVNSDPDLEGLRLRGANAGNPAGVLPAGEPLTISLGYSWVASFRTFASGVTFDGFAITAPESLDYGIVVQDSDVVVRNNILDTQNGEAVGVYVFETGGQFILRQNHFVGFASGFVSNTTADASVVVVGNLIHDGVSGIRLIPSPRDIVIEFNSLFGNSLRDMEINVNGETISGIHRNDLTSDVNVTGWSDPAPGGMLDVSNNYWRQGAEPGPQQVHGSIPMTISPHSPTPFTNFPGP